MIDSLLGSTLLNGSSTVATTAACKGKSTIALYFSAHWCGPCRGFTPSLVAAYAAAKASGNGNECLTVFCSSDSDEDAFKAYYAEMTGFHALPYSDRATKEALSTKFGVEGIPSLVVIDAITGELITTDGRSLVGKYGGAAFPLTAASIKNCKAAAAENKSRAIKDLTDVTAFGGVLAGGEANGGGSSLAALLAPEGSHVALVIGDGDGSDGMYAAVESTLAKVGDRCSALVYLPWSLYNGESDHASFSAERGWATVDAAAWAGAKASFAALFGESADAKINPALLILRGGPVPSIVSAVDSMARALREHGAEGFPYDPVTIAARVDAAAAEATAFKSTFQSDGLLALKGMDGWDGSLASGSTSSADATSIDEVVAKLAAGGDDARLALYFSAHWCGPCRGFTPTFAATYDKLAAKGAPFETIFVSSDRDDAAFAAYHASMPWLALPFAQRELKEKLSALFGVRGIPSVVLLKGFSQGKCEIDTTEGRSSIMLGASTFPWGPGAEEKSAAAAKEAESESIATQLAAGVPPITRRCGDLLQWGTLDTASRTVDFEQFATLAAPSLVTPDGGDGNDDIYYELEITKCDGGMGQIGFATAAMESTDAYSGDGVGDDASSWGFDGVRNSRWNGGHTEPWCDAATTVLSPRDAPPSANASWAVGDVLCLRYSAVDKSISCAKNGAPVAEGDSIVGIPPGVFPAFTAQGMTMKYTLSPPFKHASAYAAASGKVAVAGVTAASVAPPLAPAALPRVSSAS